MSLAENGQPPEKAEHVNAENETVQFEENGVSKVDSTKTVSPEDVPKREEWSVVLNSSALGAATVQPTESSKAGSPPALGLQVTTDRGKKLTKSGRLCAALLFDIAGYFDTYGQSLLKSCQSLPSSESSPIEPQILVALSALELLSSKMKLLAGNCRASVARPFHTTFQSLEETVPNIYQRYTSVQIKSVNARAQALKVRVKYVKAVHEAEAALEELKKAKADSPTTTDTNPSNQNNDAPAANRLPWETTLRRFGRKHGIRADRLIQKLKDVQSLESQYVKLVKEENKAIGQTVAMETMALESLQKLEDQRMEIFVESISKFVQMKKDVLEVMEFSTTPVESGLSGSRIPSKTDGRANGERTTANDFFKNLLKPSSSQGEDFVGAMEAETVGLPVECGKLRDEVLAMVRASEKRSAATKAIATCLEEVAGASTSLAASISNRLNREGYGGKKASQPDSLVVTLQANEGPSLLAYWNAVVELLEKVADASRQLAGALMQSRRSRFDNFLQRGDKELRSVGDGDDTRWKYVCDMARAETKAESKYQISTSEFAKARERVQSLDDGKSGNRERASSAPIMSSPMGKAFGNVISMLPNRGEQAMKMMTHDARRLVARTSLGEADMRESKQKGILEAATSAKEQAIKSYVTAATSLLENLRSGDQGGWNDLKLALESVVPLLQGFRLASQDKTADAERAFPDKSARTRDFVEWTNRARDYLLKNSDGASASALTVQLVKSRSVRRVLTLVGSDSEDIDFSGGGGEDANDAADSSAPGNGKTQTSDDTSPKTEDSGTLNGHMSQNRDLVIEKPEGEPPSEKTTAPHTNEQFKGVDSSSADFMLAHFLSDRDKDDDLLTVLASFSCAFWPKHSEGYISHIIHGRLFVTASSFCFVEWGGKKLILNWNSVLSVSKEECLSGTEDSSLQIKCTRDGEDKSYFFGAFTERDKTFEIIEKAREEAALLASKSNDAEDDSPQTGDPGTVVPPDSTLQRMEMLLSKKMKGVTVQKFYKAVWSEGQGTDAKPLYGPWLAGMGSEKVFVGQWEFSEDGKGYKKEWCGETYQQKRSVRFQFKRTTHLYVGPPMTTVNQTHYCRVEGNDKCVLSMTVEMEGIPYADCFAVEVRWVARRVGADDLEIDVAVTVNFKKSTMFAKKIRSGTVSETKKVYLKLFEHARIACTGSAESVEEIAGEEQPTSTVEEPVAKNILSEWVGRAASALGGANQPTALILFLCGVILVLLLTRSRAQGYSGEVADLSRKVDEMSVELKEIHETLRVILDGIKNAPSQ